nr:hypothetical protein [Mesorhizobium sp.]
MDSAQPAASNHAKGEIKVLSLSEAEIKKCIDLRKLLDALSDGFKALSNGRVVNPARPQLDIPNAGYSLAMPAWMKGMHLTVKLVNVFEGNIARGIPSHLATIQLFDPETGMPVCIMDGTYITAVRTSGSAVLSVRELARRDAKVVTVVGAGVQASQHLHLLPLVRDFQEIRVFSKDFADAQALASHHSRVTAVEDLGRGTFFRCRVSRDALLRPGDIRRMGSTRNARFLGWCRATRRRTSDRFDRSRQPLC